MSCPRIPPIWDGTDRWLIDWVAAAVLWDPSHVVSVAPILTSKVSWTIEIAYWLITVYEGQTGLVLKFGKYHRAVDPGLCRVNPLSEKLQQVDIKITVVEVPSQVCMTKDNVNVHITSVIYYHIVNPYKATFGIGSVRTALIERTQTTLRHVLGARVLQDVIERREEIAQSIEEIIAEVATTWGVKVESILIKDINFSRELQDSLSMAAQSKRIGESKVPYPSQLSEPRLIS